MLKIKAITGILVLSMSIGVLAGCGSSQQKPAASGQPAASQPVSSQPTSTGKLVDGVYKVEYDKFDGHDYKGQLELTVSGGKVTAVKYDEIDKNGKFKSQDEKYKEKMLEGSKTYPAKAYDELQKQLIAKQSSAIDAVSGATASSNNFKGLLKYALDDMARKGTTTPAKIPAPKE